MPGLSNSESYVDFVNDRGVGALPHIDDSTQALWTRFSVTSQSTYVYINDDGTWERTGYGSLISDVEELISN